jgi:predicted dinucleotide-binding enzyme
MRVAVIGAGNVGKALGGALATKRHDVVYGVRDLKKPDAKPADTIEPHTDATGPLLREHAAVLAGEAVDAGDLPSARLLEPLAMLWIKLAFAQGLGRDLARRN